MKRAICLLCTALLLTSCGNSAKYITMPSGTNETEAPVIYTPSVSGEKTDGGTEEAGFETQDYAPRLAKFLERYANHNLYMECEVVTNNKTDSTTEKVTYVLAYKDKFSYVNSVSSKNIEYTIISNENNSYLVDTVFKTAQKAEQGTFKYTRREDIDFLFPEGEGAYTGTVTKTYNDMELSCDCFIYNDISYMLGYDSNEELILIMTQQDDRDTCVIFKSVTVCDSDDYFKITKDYAISDYVAN